jgi:hypothetical protein
MENIQLQNMDLQNVRRAMQGANASDLAQGGMDAFALIFEQMAMGMMQNQEDGLVMGEDLLAGFMENPLEGFMENSDDESDKTKTDDLMMQIAGTMLVQNPQWMMFLQQDDASAVQTVSELNLPADVKQFLMDARVAAQNTQQTNVDGLFTETVRQQTTVQPSEPSGDTQTGTSDRFVEILSKGQENDTSSDELYGLQDTFLRNVREAKSLLDSEKKSDSKELPLDIDQLQSDVMSNRFNPLSSIEGRTARTEFNQEQTPEIDQQIQDGITENLLRGQKEFVIKLQPEGLGEITVKLLEKPGEASVLSLVTSSAESAKLINDKLNTLQEAMRPLQVQVNMAAPDQTVEASQAGSQADNFQQSFLFDQNQSGANQQQGQRPHQSSGGKIFSLTDDGLLQEETIDALAAADGLDTYI